MNAVCDETNKFLPVVHEITRNSAERNAQNLSVMHGAPFVLILASAPFTGPVVTLLTLSVWSGGMAKIASHLKKEVSQGLRRGVWKMAAGALTALSVVSLAGGALSLVDNIFITKSFSQAQRVAYDARDEVLDQIAKGEREAESAKSFRYRGLFDWTPQPHTVKVKGKKLSQIKNKFEIEIINPYALPQRQTHHYYLQDGVFFIGKPKPIDSKLFM